MWKNIVFIAILATVKCNPMKEEGVAENFVGAISDCVENDTSLCLKEKALKVTERLAVIKEVDLLEGITLVNTGSSRSARSYEPLAEDLKTRESQVEERIADNVAEFFDNHVLQLRLSEPDNESRGLDEESRGKKKKKIKQLLPILLLLKMKLVALIPLFLGIIAFVAVKAVFLGKIAFAVQAVSLIRKLLSKNNSHSSGSTYTHVAPHHHDEHPGYSYEPAQSWSRNVNDAQNLAYSGHTRR